MGLLDIPGYVRGIFNSTPPALANGQRSELQLDAGGALLVNPGALSATTDSVGSYGAALAVPFSATSVSQVAVTDVGAYAWWSMVITTQGTGSSVVPQISDDGNTWRNTVFFDTTNITGVGTTNTGATTTVHGPIFGRYFRLSIQSITAGTTSGTLQFYTTARSLTAFGATLASEFPATASGLSGTPVAVSSGVVANATATATMPAVGGRVNYLAGFEVTGSGATAEAVVTVSIAGPVNTLSYVYTATAGVTKPNTPLIVEFAKPIAASASNTSITITCPALGSGNTANSINAHGYAA